MTKPSFEKCEGSEAAGTTHCYKLGDSHISDNCTGNFYKLKNVIGQQVCSIGERVWAQPVTLPFIFDELVSSENHCIAVPGEQTYCRIDVRDEDYYYNAVGSYFCPGTWLQTNANPLSYQEFTCEAT